MKKYVGIILVIIWCLIIFIFSNMNTINSNGLSKKVIEYSITNIVKLTNKLNITNIESKDIPSLVNKLNLPIRKCAHASIYLVLGILLLIVLNSFKIPLNKQIIICLSICFIYSLIDEYHQTFIPGRTGQFTDCLIDTGGALLGIVIYKLIKRKNKE